MTVNGSNPTLAVTRQAQIRTRLQIQQTVRVDELAAWLRVSAATIRRDLAELERQGALRRVHGGAAQVAKAGEEPLFDDKAAIATAEKDAIARAALKLISPTDTIFLDGGSTVLALARLLLPLTKLTVVTNSLRVAQLLSGNGPRMIVTGGECRRLSQTFVGPLSSPVLERVQFDWAFMGTIGISAAGLTTTDPNEAFTKNLAISHARQVALLADSGKFGQNSFVQFGNLGQITHLITDQDASLDHLEELRHEKVDIIIATV